MSSFPQSPAIQLPNEDRDLDNDELWAVIDSASASAAASRSRIHPPLLAIKNSTRNPRFPPSSNHHLALPSDGEVIEDDHWTHHRPPKMAKLATDHRLLVVKNSPRNATVNKPSPSASMYSSPEPMKYGVKDVNPVAESPASVSADQWRSEEKENLRPHSLSGRFPSVSAFMQYQNAAMAILEKTDYTMISGSPFIKKSGWRKISFYFNLSFEIRDKSIEFDENRNVQRAEFVVRAYMQGGRFSDGWGSCERREKRFMKPNHDIPSTAETRAKNKACQDLLGIGEYRPGVKL